MRPEVSLGDPSDPSMSAPTPTCLKLPLGLLFKQLSSIVLEETGAPPGSTLEHSPSRDQLQPQASGPRKAKTLWTAGQARREEDQKSGCFRNSAMAAPQTSTLNSGQACS